MKKLLFVLAFAFIGQQVFSQIFLVTISERYTGSCSNSQLTLTKVPPSGSQIHTCIERNITDGGLEELNQELNSVANQGYKLIETSYAAVSSVQSLVDNQSLQVGTAFIFAIP